MMALSAYRHMCLDTGFFDTAKTLPSEIICKSLEYASELNHVYKIHIKSSHRLLFFLCHEYTNKALKFQMVNAMFIM